LLRTSDSEARGGRGRPNQHLPSPGCLR